MGLFKNNFPKIKNRAFVKDLEEYKSVETHWIDLHMNANNRRTSYDATYFESFGVEHIARENKKYIGNKIILSNIYIIQAYYSIICGYFCIQFIYFMLKGKILVAYINLFSPNEYEKNDKIILR